MAKNEQNLFRVTAYYSGNTCFLDESHSFRTCEILCQLLRFRDADLVTIYDNLKHLLQKLLFKLNLDYDAWENYDRNVYRAQAMLNEVKNLLLRMPLYRHIVRAEFFDDSDLIRCLSLHSGLFDSEYDRSTCKAEKDAKEETLRSRGIPDDVIKRIMEADDEEDDAVKAFHDSDHRGSYAEDRRYRERDYGFYDSHVLEAIPTFEDDMRHFRPKWLEDAKEKDYLGAELLNRDLRALIEPYLDFLETLTGLEDTYGTLLNRYIHSEGRYLRDAEYAELYRRYLTEQPAKKQIQPGGTMSMVCKVIRQKGKPILCECYTFDSLSAFLYFDFFRGLRQGYLPRRCDLCGRYFLLTAGRYYDYCDRPVKGKDGKTCRDLGAHKKYEKKCKSDPVWLAYNRAYKAHYARLLKQKMTKSEFLTWSTWAAEYRDTALRGRVKLEVFEEKVRE